MRLKKIVFFQHKIKLNKNFNKYFINKISKKNIGNVVIGEYLSIDRDGINQYKFGGACLKIKTNFFSKNILITNNLGSVEVKYLLNLSSPLLYFLKIMGSHKK